MEYLGNDEFGETQGRKRVKNWEFKNFDYTKHKLWIIVNQVLIALFIKNLNYF